MQMLPEANFEMGCPHSSFSFNVVWFTIRYVICLLNCLWIARGNLSDLSEVLKLWPESTAWRWVTLSLLATEISSREGLSVARRFATYLIGRPDGLDISRTKIHPRWNGGSLQKAVEIGMWKKRAKSDNEIRQISGKIRQNQLAEGER